MNKSFEKKYKVLVIGDSWNGSDCTGLARGFREVGCAVEQIGQDQFSPKSDRSFMSKVLKRLLNRFFKKQFNRHILKYARIIEPHITVVYKGNYVDAQTLLKLREESNWLTNFYPDISLMNHSSVDIDGFKHYHHIFTTKSFGVEDYERNLGLTEVSFLAHGFDPYVHRVMNKELCKDWENDVSFIGGWSEHKERLLRALKISLPDIKLKIWGPDWENNKSKCLEPSIEGYAIYGDFYAIAINASRINLGLLQEKVEGASSGDLTTARTFHIPAAGGFMLHERTDEVLNYYKEDKEIACFSSDAELVQKVKFYLSNVSMRNHIAEIGQNRCLADNKHSHRARSIIAKYELEFERRFKFK